MSSLGSRSLGTTKRGRPKKGSKHGQHMCPSRLRPKTPQQSIPMPSSWLLPILRDSRSQLAPEHRHRIFALYTTLPRNRSGNIAHGSLRDLGSKLGVSVRTIHRVAVSMIKELEVSDSPTGKARPRSGRPSIMDDAKDEQLRAFALQHHYDFTWLEAAEAIGGISAASLWRWAQYFRRYFLL